ncbi:ATP-binding response regulator [Caenimonas aquaedulcis]|uniref:Response regulator n=1 Tax=Caenimonas aquaedulcis TaxID=2793270 RepID=A0A931MGZ5_9BURK|nr:response regulator [Caenimonas aquaedulcis]MBG9388279.1 response regulator [Caenimonas aquaedulcis]
MSVAHQDHAAHTVLVVDDHPAARYATCRAVRAAGFQVLECATGAAGLQMARQGVSAVVLDVHLPDLHGFEVCRLLRADPATRTIPVVHVSAIHVGTNDMVNGLGAGADAYYVSPVEPSVLVATLDALIRARTEMTYLAAQDRRFRGIFEGASSAIALVGASGELLEVNAAFAELAQTHRQRLTGVHLSKLVPVDWTVRVEALAAGWSGTSWTGKFPLSAGRRGAVPVEWSVSPHPDEHASVAVARLDPAGRP